MHTWNWQHPEWPRLQFDPLQLAELEQQFLIESARLIGASSVIDKEQRQTFTIELMSEEALKSSRIEDEMLNRESVASSLLHQFGLAATYSDHRASEKEQGIAGLMVDAYRHFRQPLTHEMLCSWHTHLMSGNRQMRDIGRYRTGPEPMRVVSGYIGSEKIYFEAPPSILVAAEMEAFVSWYNQTAPGGDTPLPALTRAGLAHIHFLSIHPFEDGNGRIGRAISEKALAQSIEMPGLFALSHAIERNRPEYYRQLERNQCTPSVQPWLNYFARTVLEATAHSQRLVRFIVAKTRLLDRLRDRLNERQHKVLIRMLAEGSEGFRGGLSAEKYCKITGTIARTASRDLAAMMEMGALIRTGSHKGTRYWLNLGEEFEDAMREHLARQNR